MATHSTIPPAIKTAARTRSGGHVSRRAQRVHFDSAARVAER